MRLADFSARLFMQLRYALLLFNYIDISKINAPADG